MHGTAAHKQRVGAEAKQDPKAEIDNLRQLMAKAIKEENFEEAARLRDEIREREVK